MTAILPDRHLITTDVVAATNRIAALEHLPAAEAHDLVTAIAPLVTAAKLRHLAAEARLTMHVRNGCCRVVRADELLRVAAELADDAVVIAGDIAEQHAHDEPGDSIEHLQRENALLRAQINAVMDALAERACTQRRNWGEHPPTPEDLAKVERDSRAYWTRIAHEGSEVDATTPAGAA